MKIIIGIGSHSEVIYSILSIVNNDVKFVSYPSICDVSNMSQIIKKHYLGGIDTIVNSKDEFIIGLGDNKLRDEIYNKYSSLNYINAIHPRATILESVKIGIGNVICAGVVIQTGTTIGDHNIINTNSSIDHHNYIANFCHIAPNCAVCGNVTIYDGVFLGVGSSIVPKIKIRPYTFVKANSLVKESTAPIPIYEPLICQYTDSAMDAVKSGWISSLGKYINLATNKLKEIINVPYVLLVNNGTSATHCLFIALKYKYPNIKKIYIPNNVYVAAWNCALMEYNKNELEVMNIDLNTWNIDTSEEYIQSLEKDSAVMIVHNVGNIINVPRLKEIRPDIIFVEDNCEGLFGKYNDKYTGTTNVTLCSSISFFGNKSITSGEGGAITTTDKSVYDYLYKTCHQGQTEVRYIHDVLGYNYRMTNVQAAFLYDQLMDLVAILEKKRNIFNNYDKLLEPYIKSSKILIQTNENNTIRAHWMYAIRINNTKLSFKEISEHMTKCGIDIRPMFYPIDRHNHLSDILKPIDENAIKINQECLMLPSSPTLTIDEQKYIIKCLSLIS